MNLSIENQLENISHYKVEQSLEKAAVHIRERIITRGDLPHITQKKQLELLEQLLEFSFGCYIVEHSGANGYWTDYLINYPNDPTSKSKTLTPLEDFILNRSLLILSHRERFNIFQKLLQERIQENVVLASVPCGLMRDLITLDFSHVNNYRLFGIDIDPESISLAQNLIDQHKIKSSSFFQQDAWKLEFANEFDVITSSGLNVYESDPKKVLDLYKRFYRALKPRGTLIISVLTYPPEEKKKTDWDLSIIDKDDLLMEQVIYKDILDLHWRNFRSIDELDLEFKMAGFSKVDIILDQRRIFPTIIAQK